MHSCGVSFDARDNPKTEPASCTADTKPTHRTAWYSWPAGMMMLYLNLIVTQSEPPGIFRENYVGSSAFTGPVSPLTEISGCRRRADCWLVYSHETDKQNLYSINLMDTVSDRSSSSGWNWYSAHWHMLSHLFQSTSGEYWWNGWNDDIRRKHPA